MLMIGLLPTGMSALGRTLAPSLNGKRLVLAYLKSHNAGGASTRCEVADVEAQAEEGRGGKGEEPASAHAR